MFNHGLSAAGMFFLVGVVYDRIHTRNLDEMGGYFPLVPVYGGILIFTSMASLGLPGLNGFVSEFLVVRGAWPIFTKSLHGPLDETHSHHLTEINKREIAVIAPLMVLMLWLGVWPSWLLDVIDKAMMALQSAIG
jgi:NADH-quinone oxidoreductase subunit M